MEDDPFGPLTGGSRETWSQSQDIGDDPDEEQEIVVATPAAPKPARVQEVLRTPKKAAKKPEGRKQTNSELLQTILAAVQELKEGKAELQQELQNLQNQNAELQVEIRSLRTQLNAFSAPLTSTRSWASVVADRDAIGAGESTTRNEERNREANCL